MDKPVRIMGFLIGVCLLCPELWAFAAPSADVIEQDLKAAGAQGFQTLVNVKIVVPEDKNPYLKDAKYYADPRNPELGAYLLATVLIPDRVKTDGPTILITTAYKREIVKSQCAALVNAGYNIVMVDMRGTGGSQGHWNSMGLVEQYDVKYLIDDWIPDQEWSDGRVGMVGGSYMAILQLLAAGIVDCDAQGNPIHLKACFASVPLSDTYADIAMHGGNFDLEFMSFWMAITETLGILPSSLYLGQGALRPGNPLDLNAPDVVDATREWLNSFLQFPEPFYDFILETRNEVRGGGTLLNEVSTMRYWPDKPAGGWDVPTEKFQESSRAIPATLPVLLMGGWYDIFTRGTLNYYQHGLSRHADKDKKLIVGEWYHSEPFLNIAMGVKCLETLEFQRRWFDWKLRGKADAFMTEFPVLLYVLGENRWRAEKDWPLPEKRVERKTLYLSKQKADPIPGDWFTHWPGNQLYALVEDKADRSLSAPHPVMRHGAEPWNLHGASSRSSVRWLAGLPALPTQIAKHLYGLADSDAMSFHEDERADECAVPTFTTPALGADLEIVGPLSLRFWAETEYPAFSPWGNAVYNPLIELLHSVFGLDTENDIFERMVYAETVQWVVELNDVFPDGRAKNITSGWLRATCRPYDPALPEGVMRGGKIEHPVDPGYTPFDPFYFLPTTYPLPKINAGQRYEYVIELWPTCNVFKKGHRIRVSLSGSDFPHLLPVFTPSDNTIVIDAEHEARLDFTVANRGVEGRDWKWITSASEPGYSKNPTALDEYLLHARDAATDTADAESSPAGGQAASDDAASGDGGSNGGWCFISTAL